MSWEIKLKERVAEVEAVIQKYLPEETGYQKTVLEAMNYSVLAGGKRLRPMLMEETYRLFGGNSKIVEPFMAAIEMIHTYSLVHDDLPSMDNDEYRRGRKTTHVVYGEGMAILAGDGLLNYAFETALKAFDMEPANPAIGKAMQVLAKKAGVYGMIGGQTADIQAEDMDQSKVTNELLLFIHENKTAALIQSSMMIGAILAGASAEAVAAVEKIAYNVGIAFQIQDDILDITSSLEVLGKMTGSDEKNNKVTYVTLNGMEKSKEDVEKLSKEAIDLLDSFENKNEFLNQLIEELITREK
ncbi:MAG: polyprenyl synthetase family protein [Lachnospiraceae bacterium]|nr:polyprenyl synthetase family protein [Lachnospiraceae bacterium]